MAKKKGKKRPAPRQNPQQAAKQPPRPTPAPDQDPADTTIEGTFDLIEETIQPQIATLEELRGHTVIAYFIDDGGQLADEQMLHLYEHLRRIGQQKKIALWLHSRGGSTVVPVKIVALVRSFCDQFAVLVPYRCHSAATHIAMGADEIVMTEMSELGPVDPSRSHPLLPRVKGRDGEELPLNVSVQDLRHVLSFIEREIGGEEIPPDAAATIYTALFDKVHPLAIGGLEQSYELAHQVSDLVLSTHMDVGTEAEDIRHISDRIGEHYKGHTFPVTRDEAKKIGLKVVDANPAETDAIWALYTAYTNIGISGAGQINGDPAQIARVGHIDTVYGTTLGVQLTSKRQPQNQMTQWQSKWLTEPKPAGT